jgi:hypothetical protein
MTTMLFPDAPPLPSQVTVFKTVLLFEVYLLLLQQQETPAPIGMTVAEYNALTREPNTPPMAIQEETAPIAISDSPQTIEDIIGNAHTSDAQRLHGDAATRVATPTRQQLQVQESADTEAEIAALKARIAQLQQDAAHHEEFTRIHAQPQIRVRPGSDLASIVSSITVNATRQHSTTTRIPTTPNGLNAGQHERRDSNKYVPGHRAVGPPRPNFHRGSTTSPTSPPPTANRTKATLPPVPPASPTPTTPIHGNPDTCTEGHTVSKRHQRQALRIPTMPVPAQHHQYRGMT